MSRALQITLMIISVLSLVLLIQTVKKNHMNIRYSILWIVLCFVIILLSIFPKIIYWIGSLIGIITPVNTVYLMMIFLSFCLVFYLYLKISKLNQEIQNLNYELAVLKKTMKE